MEESLYFKEMKTPKELRKKKKIKSCLYKC